MITPLQQSDTELVRVTDAAMNVAPDDCRIIEQDRRSGRRLRNLILVGNAIAWIVIIFVARALLF